MGGLAIGLRRAICERHPSKEPAMRLSVFLLLASLGLAGCTYSSSSPPPPAAGTTVVLPPGSTVVCSNGSAPPCQ
jgi:hypothetical protein